MINFEDIPYRTVDGHILEGRLYRPNSPNGKWVVDVHGGAWSSGDRLNNAVIHNDLTANGVGVFALDFRLSDVAQYPIPVQDVSWGVRWFKDNLRALGIHASSIGGLASSSGAQQMGLVALSPDGEDWTPAAPEIGDADSSLDFFVAAWPIFDPLRRYHLMRQIGNDRLIAAHDACLQSIECLQRYVGVLTRLYSAFSDRCVLSKEGISGLREAGCAPAGFMRSLCDRKARWNYIYLTQ